MGGFAPTITINTATRHILTPFQSTHYHQLIISANFSFSFDVYYYPTCFFRSHNATYEGSAAYEGEPHANKDAKQIYVIYS